MRAAGFTRGFCTQNPRPTHSNKGANGGRAILITPYHTGNGAEDSAADVILGNMDPEERSQLKRDMETIAQLNRRNGTIANYRTYITSCLKAMYIKLKIDPNDWVRRGDLSDPSTWPMMRVNRHTILYCAMTTEITSTHETADSSRKYLTGFNLWWKSAGLGNLFPPIVMEQVAPFFKGLLALKNHTRKMRRGHTPEHLRAFTQLSLEWIASGKMVRGLKWDWRWHSVLRLFRHLAFIKMLRGAETSATERDIQNNDTDEHPHLFRNYEKVLVRDAAGKITVDSVLLDPPEFKVSNVFTSEKLCASYDATDDLNVAAALLEHAEYYDPIGRTNGTTPEEWASTPLLRDPRTSQAGSPGGSFLKPSVILEIHRLMMKELPELFEYRGLKPSDYGNHRCSGHMLGNGVLIARL